MAELFNITHEVGDLSEYTDTTGATTITNTTDAALIDTRGLSIDITSTTEQRLEKTITNTAASEYRLRFHIDPNGLTSNPADVMGIVGMFDSANSWNVMRLDLVPQVSGGPNIRVVSYNNGGVINTAGTQFGLTDAPHYIEVHLGRGGGGPTGFVILYIDGTFVYADGDLTNDTIAPDTLEVGVGVMIGTINDARGIFYLDEIVLRDDGTEIGEAVAAPLGLSAGTISSLTAGFRRRYW